MHRHFAFVERPVLRSPLSKRQLDTPLPLLSRFHCSHHPSLTITIYTNMRVNADGVGFMHRRCMPASQSSRSTCHRRPVTSAFCPTTSLSLPPSSQALSVSSMPLPTTARSSSVSASHVRIQEFRFSFVRHSGMHIHSSICSNQMSEFK